MNLLKKLYVILSSLFIVISISLVMAGCGTKDMENNPGGNQSETSGKQNTSTQETLAKSDMPGDVLEGVTLSISQKDISNTGVKAEFFNSTEKNVEVGRWFMLKEYVNGEWKDVEYITEDVSFTDEAYIIKSSETREMDYDWTYIYGDLPSGKYVLITKVIDFVAANNYTTYYASACFTIK